MNHDELVERAAKWLRGTMRCKPVIVERNAWGTSETPDAFGVHAYGTIVVECKVTAGNFTADRRKPHRRYSELGMGRQRYYLTPPDVLTPEQMEKAPGWGFLEVRGRITKIVRPSMLFTCMGHAEAILLRSAWLGENDRSQP